MNVLVMNSGSSSIKFSVFAVGGAGPRSLFEGELSGVGGETAHLTLRDAEGKNVAGEHRGAVGAGSTQEAIHAVMDVVFGGTLPKIGAVGYRVVHPGAKLKAHCRITETVLQDLVEAAVFAPLHDPTALEVIRAVMGRMPQVPHFACFDTIFHESMSKAAMTYALPEEVRAQGVRRYGFHGLSCESIVRQMLDAADRGEIVFPKRMVIAHLGSGCSVTAVVRGRSVDTTMGLTPTGGVVMGTRPGDLDPGVMLYLLRQGPGGKAEGSESHEEQVAAVEEMVNHRAGIVALSGMANDMKAVREAAGKGDERALLAVEVFTRSIRKAIGGFCWLMGGLDAIVFAGGIGEHDAASRAEILRGLEGLGVELDHAANEAHGDGVRRVSGTFPIAVYVVPAEEDLMIAVHVAEMMG
ncbi:acetate/propionate family kinase [Granulicella sp. dw_53]|uniref:acetate/propionate family kinase n=1 Tax=Granulicella sp. dw_53 TaxID=2719792 RepID=UPI001BD27787|nr:acetate/propionate family kinase [Granulicella sp. dw_53]